MGCVPATKTKPLNTEEHQTLEIIDDFHRICPQYTYKKTLGYGKYGFVFLAHSLDTKRLVAIKVLPLTSRFKSEPQILAALDHPNIVKCYRHYQSAKHAYIVMEHCVGEELFGVIARRKTLREGEAVDIMEKMLRAVSHCHEVGVIHCDLKPENVMVSRDGVVKVIDFGLAVKADSKVCGIAGTPHFIAPEIINCGLYTKAADMWALGITMHIMLTGYIPIAGKEFDEIKQRIRDYSGPEFASRKWKSISPEAKDLLKRMLEPSYAKRITAVEALRHPWFTKRSADRLSCNVAVLEALQRYSEFPEVKKNILGIIVRNIEDIELKEYQQMFLELDKTKTGLITSQDLESALSTAESRTTRKELEELIKKVNQRGLDFISYSEFVAALIATRGFLTEERLSGVFKIIEQEQEESQKVIADSL